MNEYRVVRADGSATAYTAPTVRTANHHARTLDQFYPQCSPHRVQRMTWEDVPDA
jgi:hypothetical protein